MKSVLKNIIICSCFCLPPALFIEAASFLPGIEAWFAQAENAEEYMSIKEEVIALCRQAQAEGLPPELLFDKFREGAAKAISPQRILEAMREEARRLAEVTTMLTRIDEHSLALYDHPYFQLQGGLRQAALQHGVNIDDFSTVLSSRTDIVRQISIFLRSGLSLQLMEETFAFSSLRQQFFLFALDLFKAIIGIPAFGRLDDRELLELCRTVLKSPLPASAYPVLPSLFMKGNRYELSYAVIAHLISEELDRGGGLIQVEQALKRRGKR